MEKTPLEQNMHYTRWNPKLAQHHIYPNMDSWRVLKYVLKMIIVAM